MPGPTPANRAVMFALLAAAAGQVSAQSRSDSSFAAVQARGAVVMGVDQYSSHHVFEDLVDGGRIILFEMIPPTLRAPSDPAAPAGRRRQFRAGIFADPRECMPVKSPERPSWRSSATRSGIKSAIERAARNSGSRPLTAAIAAVRRFLAFQREDHHAGAHEGMHQGARSSPHQQDRWSLSMTSTAFGSGGAIPAKYTCEGADLSPPLAWTGVPPAARSLVLIVDDPDAPDPAAPKMTWVHWVLYNLPPATSGLAGGSASRRPAGRHSRGAHGLPRTGWAGPCPPIGRHRYFFKLYALDQDTARQGSPDQGPAGTGHGRAYPGSGRADGNLRDRAGASRRCPCRPGR